MRLRKRWAWVVIIGAAVIIAGCEGARENARMTLQAQRLAHSAPERSGGPPGIVDHLFSAGSVTESLPRAEKPRDTPAPGPASGVTLTALEDSRPDRYLIKNATITLEVKDVRKASTELAAAVQAARGYISDTHETVDELGRRSATIQVRVPFIRFDPALQQIEALGKVVEKQITAEDVTEEFVDSQAKLRNLQRTELRLLEHLNRTGRLSDVLLVEKELNRVRGEIDQLEGRLRFLAHRVAFSTLTLTLSEAPRPQQTVPPETYSSGKVVTDAMRSVVAFGQVLCTLAIWIAIWAVVWLPIALAAWFAYRHRRRAPAA